MSFLLDVLSKTENIPSIKIAQEFALTEYYMKTSNLHPSHWNYQLTCLFDLAKGMVFLPLKFLRGSRHPKPPNYIFCPLLPMT